LTCTLAEVRFWLRAPVDEAARKLPLAVDQRL